MGRRGGVALRRAQRHLWPTEVIHAEALPGQLLAHLIEALKLRVNGQKRH